MEIPEDRKYTRDHEWIKIDGGVATVGITEFAQAELGELVFVDLPSVGKSVKQKDSVCVVESTKAASDVYSPVSGKVESVNGDLSNNPNLVNQEPYSNGWLVKLTDINEAEVGALMTAADYKALINK